ncbi:MAG: hypothetical protein L3J23_07395 [Flavobacteriaceae bacterium]|nr:hypothetical protein [Flavobacteriaceae bacterium]
MVRIYLLHSLLIIIVMASCKAQNNNTKQDTMKTFDIETFEKNKNRLNDYTFITQDSTTIAQDEWQFGYEETIKPKNSYFQTFNKYYRNGKLKLTGDFFPNDFEKGTWKEYNQQGALIKETDYDKPFKFTFKDILKFIKKRNIDMNGDYFEITRGIGTDNHPYWGIVYEIESKLKLQTIEIDGVLGKIVGEGKENYPE